MKTAERKLEEMIEYLSKMADECPEEGMKIDKYFLKHTVLTLEEIREDLDK